MGGAVPARRPDPPPPPKHWHTNPATPLTLHKTNISQISQALVSGEWSPGGLDAALDLAGAAAATVDGLMREALRESVAGE